MTVQLPKTIAEYFAADKERGARAIAACFTESAVVRDEGITYSGREAICRWKAESSTKYVYTVEPISIEIEDDRAIVTSHLVGNFPGSPVDLRYFFILEGDEIAELEIVP